MSFWKQLKPATDEFVTEEFPITDPDWESPPFVDLVSNRMTDNITKYTPRYKERWNHLRLCILKVFFRENLVSRRSLNRETKRALSTDLNTLAWAEVHNVFNKELFTSLYRPYGEHVHQKFSIPEDIWDALCLEAKSKQIGVYDLIRKILIHYVDAYPRCGLALELLARPAPRFPPTKNYLEPKLTQAQIQKIMFGLQ